MSDKIVLVGYSGHGLVVADVACLMNLPLKYYCEKVQMAKNPFGLSYLGDEQSADFLGWNDSYRYILGIGDNRIRFSIAEKILGNSGTFINVIHPSASLSKHLNMGMGNFINTNVVVNSMTNIGDFSILNSGCIIEHECKIGKAVHIAPGAILAGNVEIGDLTFVGAGSVIKQGVTVGSNVIIGAGSIVLKDVPDNSKVVGNPGRRI